MTHKAALEEALRREECSRDQGNTFFSQELIDNLKGFINSGEVFLYEKLEGKDAVR